MTLIRTKLAAVLLLILLAPALADDPTPPVLPHAFYGTITIDSAAAPVGTVIIATIDGVEKGRITTTVAGQYGGPTLDEGKLVVSGSASDEGKTVIFTVAGQTAGTALWHSSGVTELPLAATSPPSSNPPSGGSSGSSGGSGNGGLPPAKNEPVDTPDKQIRSVAQVKAGQSAKLEFLKSATHAVLDIQITVKNPITNLKITVSKLVGKPAEVTNPASSNKKVHSYLEIDKGNFVNADIESAKINFKVEKAWVVKNKIDVATIALSRYIETGWQKLDTFKSAEDETNYYFAASTLGFSVFAITGEVLPGQTPQQEPQSDQSADQQPEAPSDQSGQENNQQSPSTPVAVPWLPIAVLGALVILGIYFMFVKPSKKLKVKKK